MASERMIDAQRTAVESMIQGLMIYKEGEEGEPIVDMRSDTVTKPTERMRVEMALATVGDDVFGDDPTVQVLESEVAELLGKEAALFVPSGTMGNLICVLVHCEARGSECLLGDESHMHIYEQGGIATIGGVHPRTLPNNPDGTIDLERIPGAIRPLDDHFPVSRLLILENTHNKKGGRVLSLEYMKAAAAICQQHGIKLHIDGARLWNAAIALQVTPAAMVEHADSVNVCLSKGLGAPVGSVIASDAEFIFKARRLRKALGGGMRQVGVLAAAARVALKDNLPRLAQDHAHARYLATQLSSVPGIKIDLSAVETNLVFINTGEFSANDIVLGARERGIWIIPVNPYTIRVAFHFQVTTADVELAVKVIKEVIADVASKK
ncbi:hypothetical protein CYMTET_31921 [Cymbomonas tetramitiformis]|uniref:Aromatic amino acid beta-eliminating lyase/threonine aldolase domain-containing protein n=1 Tax=Cymbomonas tetramitiformis TaxID=36881 RepID=A0AAE0FGG4_9CHLO|nr:hypothetical protein CYMTET_31921 [Cymbomonas tetramitiformis]|eukprot:gene13222-15624_t